MNESVRLQYLEAMGIDVWVARHLPVAAVQAAEETSENVGWEDGHGEAGDTLFIAQETISEHNQTHQDNLAAQGRQIAPASAALATSSAAADTGPSAAQLSQYDQYSGQDEVGYGETEPAEFLESWTPLHPARFTHASHATDQAWKDLQHEVSLCRACSLCETRTQTVFGVGNRHATWMLIGEAPGQNEDLQGEPFVGRAGQLLTEMLRAIGLKREEVYIANILKCRPPNNRDPQAEEVAACHRFLQRQIALLQPKIILAVGRIAAQNLLKTQQPLAKLRGVIQQWNDIPLIVIHHPAYLLRSLPEKAKAWDDLKFALSVYQKLE